MDKNVKELFSTNISEAGVDGENHTLRGVAIMSTNISLNNRTYTDQAQQQIAEKVEGVACYLDHISQSEKSDRGNRSIRDFAGVFSNPVKSGNKVKADLAVAAHHWPLFENIVKLSAPCGMSLDGRMAVRQQDGKETVEECKNLNSVDFVSAPALTSGIWETHMESVKDLIKREEIIDFTISEFVKKAKGVKEVKEEDVEKFVKESK